MTNRKLRDHGNVGNLKEQNEYKMIANTNHGLHYTRLLIQTNTNNHYRPP